MNQIDNLLVLIAPFKPKSTFKKLDSRKDKVIISVVSIAITLSILLLFYYLEISRASQLNFSFEGIAFSLGFIFKILLIGAVTGILSSRLFKRSLNLRDSISIVSVSSLPLTIGVIIQYAVNQPNQVYGLIGTLFFGIVSSFGISEIYKARITQSIILMFGIIITVELLESILFGVSMSH